MIILFLIVISERSNRVRRRNPYTNRTEKTDQVLGPVEFTSACVGCRIMPQIVTTIFFVLFSRVLGSDVSTAVTTNGTTNDGSASGDAHVDSGSDSTAMGCSYNGTIYAFHETWNADLPPFGVFPCIVCQCRPENVSDAIVGQTHCSSIENSCQPLACEDQYSHPQRCCPFCEGTFPLDGTETVYHANRQFPFRGEFMALLTGSEIDDAVVTYGSGWARFVIIHNAVHYTIDFAGLESTITSVELLFERQQTVLSVPLHLLATKHKVCGVWNDLHEFLLRLFEEEELFVVVKTDDHPDGELAGDVFRRQNEWIDSFGGVLKPVLPKDPRVHRASAGAGGLAMIRLHSTPGVPSTKSLQYLIAIEGIDFVDEAMFYLPVNENNLELHREVLHQFRWNYNDEYQVFSGFWTGINETVLELLARGRIHVKVEFRRGSSKGQIRSAITVFSPCGGLLAMLSGNQKPLNAFTGAGAFGRFELKQNGSLGYHIKWFDLEGHLRSVGLFRPLPSSGPFDDAMELVFDLTGDVNEDKEELDGMWDDVPADVLSTLSEGNLQVLIGTDQYASGEITGQIQRLFLNDYKTIRKEFSLTLTGSQAVPFSRSGAVGQVWLSADDECSLHYRVVLRGVDVNDRIRSATIRGPASSRRTGSELYDIKDFFGAEMQAIGVIRQADAQLYNSLRQKRIYIEIVTDKTTVRSQLELKTNCTESTHLVVNFGEDCHECVLGDETHSSGDHWHPTCSHCRDDRQIDYDTRCYCQCGNVICWPIDLTCPPQCDCSDNEKPVVRDRCCPTCPEAEGECVRDVQLESIDRSLFLRNEACRRSDGSVYPVGFRSLLITETNYAKCITCLCQENGTMSCEERLGPAYVVCPSNTDRPDECSSLTPRDPTESPPDPPIYSSESPVLSPGPAPTMKPLTPVPQSDPAPTVPPSGTCEWQGVLYEEGETFFLHCSWKCVCEKTGNVDCKEIAFCPELECARQKWTAGECCPHCVDG
ncbi:chordin-like isoform X2 [Oscarella lobularis]|uniref:chordin-like isoform X2 n=1 Tax=Oscarella lobularis TaxID=121494 RepID=UPI003313BCEE